MKYLMVILVILIPLSSPIHATPESILETLTLTQKIAQIITIATCLNEEINQKFMAQSPYILTPDYATQCVRDYHVGGIVFLGSSTPHDVYTQAVKLQSLSSIPLFRCLDAEWGLGMRMPNGVTHYPRAMALGALSEENNHLIFELGNQIGNDCACIGINWNFAPVADVNNNRANPIINTRSFGENPQKVALKALLFSQGLEMSHTMACAKHFPGHGDTDTDSHHGFPLLKHTRNRLDSIELVPFSHAIRHGIRAIMTAHLGLPQISDSGDLPATVSPAIMTKLLRNEMHFDGLIITDALGMKGVTDRYAPGELELKALQAGCDILLCPLDVQRAIERIEQAVKSGELLEEEINTRVLRVLRAKESLSTIPPTYKPQKLITTQSLALKQRLYEAALTLVRKNKLPLDPTNGDLEVISCGSDRKPHFIQELEKYCRVHHTLLQSSDASIQDLALKRNVIVTIHLPTRSGMIEMVEGNKLPETISLAQKLSENNIVVLFGNPYNLPHFTHASDILVAYDDDEYAHKAAARSVIGLLNPQGILPVSASDEFREGVGLHY